MPDFSIVGGASTTFTDTTPGGGFVIDFRLLDNSFSVQINGVDLFVGGPAGAPNELQFQISGTSGQTVRFADGDRYEVNTPAVWQLQNSDTDPVVRLEVNPDGTIALFGVKSNDGALVPLELFNGLTVNTDAIAAAWNEDGDNTIEIDQVVTGPTNASGEFEDVPCFASGTLIETSEGLVRVEDLKVGDQVLTYDNGLRPVCWIGSRGLSQNQLEDKTHLKPIVIRANALGPGYPQRDLIVSPQHRILVSSAIAKRMFDCKDILLPAKKLLPLSGVDVLDDLSGGVRYHHILFDKHEIIWSNGTPTESLFLGPLTMQAISPEARQEIKELFPECATIDFRPLTARLVPGKGKWISKLVERHRGNRKPLFDGQAAHN